MLGFLTHPRAPLSSRGRDPRRLRGTALYWTGSQGI